MKRTGDENLADDFGAGTEDDAVPLGVILVKKNYQ
jgi:hypothetical protein